MDGDGDTAYDTESSKVGPDLPFHLSQQHLLNNTSIVFLECFLVFMFPSTARFCTLPLTLTKAA